MLSARFPSHMRRSSLALATITALSVPYNIATGQTNSLANTASVTLLNEMSVYANRSEEETFSVPGMVSVIDMGSAANAHATDFNELFGFSVGINIDSGARRSGQEFSIRGHNEDQILKLVDGRRQDFYAGHQGSFFADTALFDRVEIVRGASSASYGGGAMGGVIAFETKSVDDLLSSDKNVGARITSSYHSANREIAGTAAVYGRNGNGDALIMLSTKDSGDIKVGGDRNDYESADDIRSGLIKAGYNVGDHRFEVDIQRYQKESEEPWEPWGNSGSREEKDSTDTQVGLRYIYESDDNRLYKPEIQIYRNLTELDQRRIRGFYVGRDRHRELETIGFTAGNRTILGADNQHVISYGVDWFQDKQRASDNRTGIYGGTPNADGSHFGAYLQDEMTFAVGQGKLSVTPAVRFDSYKSSDTNGRSKSDQAISPKLSVRYEPNQNVMLFASWAKAFRGPKMTELYASGQHFPGNQFIPNPNLRPETVETIEAGVGFRGNNIFAEGDHAAIKGSVFETKGKDFISMRFDRFYTTTQFFNTSEAKIRGWEIEGGYEVDGLHAKLGLTQVKAIDSQTGKEITGRTQPLTLTAGLGYELATLNSEVGVRARFTDKKEGFYRGRSIAGYGVADLYYSWAPQGNLKGLSVDLGISNVFDKAYQTSAPGVYAKGRSYNIGLGYQW